MTTKHPNFSKWQLSKIQLDNAIILTEKAVKLSGEIVRGVVWFPLSCVEVVNQFEVLVPTWLLKEKGLNFLA
jgi:hypothetical protein